VLSRASLHQLGMPRRLSGLQALRRTNQKSLQKQIQKK